MDGKAENSANADENANNGKQLNLLSTELSSEKTYEQSAVRAKRRTSLWRLYPLENYFP